MASGVPVWRDPRYLTAARVAQLEAHEQAIRERERARERRRMMPLMPVDGPRWSLDFEGCVE